MPLALAGTALLTVLSATAASAATPPPTAPGPLTVTSPSAPGVQQLVPGQTTPWLVDVVANVDQLDELLGQLSVSGPLAHSDAVSAEVIACRVPWRGRTCASGQHLVLPATPLSAAQQARAPLQAAPRPAPGTTHLQIRVALADGADIDTAADWMTASVRVDASGPTPGATGSGDLPDTGYRLGEAVWLAVGAVTGGLLLAFLARRRKRATRAI